jgi:hypothetical protein
MLEHPANFIQARDIMSSSTQPQSQTTIGCRAKEIIGFGPFRLMAVQLSSLGMILMNDRV